jgi:hypothetical protein
MQKYNVGQRKITDFLSAQPEELLKELSGIKYYLSSENSYVLQLIKIEVIEDIDLDPDSSSYLGVKEETIDISELKSRFGSCL